MLKAVSAAWGTPLLGFFFILNARDIVFLGEMSRIVVYKLLFSTRPITGFCLD